MPVEAEMATWSKLLIMAGVLVIAAGVFSFSLLLFKTFLKLPTTGEKETVVKSLLALSIAALAACGLFMLIGSHFEGYEPQVSVLGLFIIAGSIGLVLKKRWTGLAMIFALFAIVAMYFVAASGPPPQVPMESQNVNATINANRDPTLEDLWNKLTESKIQIEPDPDYTPDLSKEETRKRVAKEQGTKANGDMPPNWVLSPNKVIGEVFRRTVDSDPFVTEAECRRQLENELLPKVVRNRLEQLLPSKVNRRVEIDDLAQYGIGLDFILREICVDEFTATVDSSVGPMKKVHVLMEFGHAEDDVLISKWMQHERDFRLARFGKIAGLTLTGLALAWGLLRFDTYSRGYYSKQLLGGSVLAIIALAVVLLRT